MAITNKDYFAKVHNFSGKSLNSEEVQRLFLDFVDRQIGTKSEFDEVNFERGAMSMGLISKQYEEGLAYAIMTFRVDRSALSSRAYSEVALSAETPYEKRRALTESLYDEIGSCLDDYFNKPVV